MFQLNYKAFPSNDGTGICDYGFFPALIAANPISGPLVTTMTNNATKFTGASFSSPDDSPLPGSWFSPYKRSDVGVNFAHAFLSTTVGACVNNKTTEDRFLLTSLPIYPHGIKIEQGSGIYYLPAKPDAGYLKKLQAGGPIPIPTFLSFWIGLGSTSPGDALVNFTPIMDKDGGIESMTCDPFIPAGVPQYKFSIDPSDNNTLVIKPWKDGESEGEL
jgi:hypothetical protein